MRYYLGQLEYKWTHVDTSMEHMWIMRELGLELYGAVEEYNWRWVLMRSNSQTLPGDVYCRCDVYAESDDNKLDSMFLLKFPQVKATPLC